MSAQDHATHCIYWTSGIWARRQQDLNRSGVAVFWRRNSGRLMRLATGGRFYMATPFPGAGPANLIIRGRAIYDGTSLAESDERGVAVANLWTAAGVSAGARNERELRELVTHTLHQRPDAPIEALILRDVEWLARGFPVEARWWKRAGEPMARNPCRLLTAELGGDLDRVFAKSMSACGSPFDTVPG
jgi:hypothetical protein